LEKRGFRVPRSLYSDANDLTNVDAEADEYLELSTYRWLLRLALRRPTKPIILRLLAYPIVKAFPSLRMLIVVVAEKVSGAETIGVHRW